MQGYGKCTWYHGTELAVQMYVGTAKRKRTYKIYKIEQTHFKLEKIEQTYS
eukprot:SAG11_NODE_21482_length_424_cov_0.904615_1_plen_50_part_10